MHVDVVALMLRAVVALSVCLPVLSFVVQTIIIPLARVLVPFVCA